MFGFPIRAIVQALRSVAGGIMEPEGKTGWLATRPGRSTRSGRDGTHADHHVRAVIHSESEPLALEANDARAARANHLHLGPVVQPHLPEPVHHVARAQNLPDATPLPRAKPAKRDQIGRRLRRTLPAPLPSSWASINPGGGLVREASLSVQDASLNLARHQLRLNLNSNYSRGRQAFANPFLDDFLRAGPRDSRSSLPLGREHEHLVVPGHGVPLHGP